MAKPTTVRVPEELLNEIDQLVKENDLDRSAYLRIGSNQPTLNPPHHDLHLDRASRKSPQALPYAMKFPAASGGIRMPFRT